MAADAPPLAPIPAGDGLLAHLVRSVRPDLYEAIRETGRIETAVVGLGGQGTRHAGLMRDFGTVIAGGVAPERGGECRLSLRRRHLTNIGAAG